MSQPNINAISNSHYLITLPPPLPGFKDFISVWAKTGNPSFIVDVGPAATAQALISALHQLDIKKLDYILLTHIHLDHAGAIGHISKAFPNTPIVCHPKAVEHLIDPSRLWEGSLKTLGDIARAYGEINPTKKTQLISAMEFETQLIHPIITPGHAPHHVSYMTPEHLFAGEASGVHIRLASGKVYQRPATPPKFFLDTSINSIDLLVEKNPSSICFGHFGMEDDALSWLLSHKKQLLLWKEIIAGQMADEASVSFYQDCIDKLIQEDSLFSPFSTFDPETRLREIELIRNSIQGYVGYLKTLSDNP